MSELRLIYEPNVYLFSRQQIDNKESQRFLRDIGAMDWQTDAETHADAIVEYAGRCCYESFNSPRPGGNAAYIDHILESRHGSVTEHSVFSFVITGISRSLSHELVRHRAGVSVSELSQRFVDSSDVAFVVPPALVDEVKEAKQRLLDRDFLLSPADPGYEWIVRCEMSVQTYRSLADYLAWKCIQRHFPQDGVKSPDAAAAWLRRHRDQATRFRKQAREAARSVLPNCAETNVFLTANVRALRNILEQRGSEDADAEIRRLACAIVPIVKREAPSLFRDIDVSGQGSSLSVSVQHSKV